MQNIIIGIISITQLKTIIFYTHSRPYLSEVTTCQVLIGTFSKEQESIKWAHNKSEFENILHDIERSGDDPIIFIKDKVLGKHISGNHRWHVKEKYRLYNTDKFEKNPYWFLTLTQLYIG